MLQNTFLHIPGIGIKSEQAFWEKGIRSWDDPFASENIGSSNNVEILGWGWDIF